MNADTEERLQMSLRGVPLGTTKQSSRFDQLIDGLRVVSEVEPLKVSNPSRDWITTARCCRPRDDKTFEDVPKNARPGRSGRKRER